MLNTGVSILRVVIGAGRRSENEGRLSGSSIL
jgi:hypothetical protein